LFKNNQCGRFAVLIQAREHLPAAFASVSFGFVLVRDRTNHDSFFLF